MGFARRLQPPLEHARQACGLVGDIGIAVARTGIVQHGCAAGLGHRQVDQRHGSHGIARIQRGRGTRIQRRAEQLEPGHRALVSVIAFAVMAQQKRLIHGHVVLIAQRGFARQNAVQIQPQHVGGAVHHANRVVPGFPDNRSAGRIQRDLTRGIGAGQVQIAGTVQPQRILPRSDAAIALVHQRLPGFLRYIRAEPEGKADVAGALHRRIVDLHAFIAGKAQRGAPIGAIGPVRTAEPPGIRDIAVETAHHSGLQLEAVSDGFGRRLVGAPFHQQRVGAAAFQGKGIAVLQARAIDFLVARRVDQAPVNAVLAAGFAQGVQDEPVARRRIKGIDIGFALWVQRGRHGIAQRDIGGDRQIADHEVIVAGRCRIAVDGDGIPPGFCPECGIASAKVGAVGIAQPIGAIHATRALDAHQKRIIVGKAVQIQQPVGRQIQRHDMGLPRSGHRTGDPVAQRHRPGCRVLRVAQREAIADLGAVRFIDAAFDQQGIDPRRLERDGIAVLQALRGDNLGAIRADQAVIGVVAAAAVGHIGQREHLTRRGGQAIDIGFASGHQGSGDRRVQRYRAAGGRVQKTKTVGRAGIAVAPDDHLIIARNQPQKGARAAFGAIGPGHVDGAHEPVGAAQGHRGIVGPKQGIQHQIGARTQRKGVGIGPLR